MFEWKIEKNIIKKKTAKPAATIFFSAQQNITKIK